MATSDNRFEQGLSQSQWIDLFGALVQFKVDKPGGVLPAEASNTRAIAEWFNTVDDLMLAAVNGTITGGQTFEYLDNTAAPQSFSTIAIGASETIQVDVTTNRNMLELSWFSLTAEEFAGDGRFTVEIGQDSGFLDRHIIYSSDFTQKPGGGDMSNESAFGGNTLMIGPQARAPISPSAGVLRFFVRLTNLNQSISGAFNFAYVVKAFDLTLTEIPLPLG